MYEKNSAHLANISLCKFLLKDDHEDGRGGYENGMTQITEHDSEQEGESDCSE